MIDVNQITTTLRGLPDRALQQYAMMHKGDPYILSLAVSESNQRKQLRAAGQGQAGAMPQPKVADAAIESMAQTQLPENQGIAQIPTPNMQRMADGGIAGYDDEEGMATGGMGGMFNFAQQSEPVVRMADGGHIPRYQGNTMDGSVVTSGDMYTQQLALRAKYEKEATEMGEGTRREFSPDVKAYAQRLSKSGNASQADYLAKEQQRSLAGNPLQSKTAPAIPDRFKTPEVASVEPQPIWGMGMPMNVGMPAGTDVSKLKQPAYIPPVDKAPPPPPGAKPAPQAKLPTGIATLKEPTAADAKAKATEFYDSSAQTRRLEQQKLQEREDISSQKEARIEQLAAFNEKQGPAYAGYEKLLKSEELQDTTDKEKAGLMSLMKGFLAMAAGESPNAATNIAKGAMVGLGDYGDALKEFKKAAKERNKAMADIENARRAESRDDLKSQQAYEEKADTRLTESNRLFTNAVMQVTGKEADISSSIFGKMVDNAEATKRTMMQEAGANARTMAQINAPGQTERLVDRMARDPKFAESYKNFASIGPEAKGVEAELQAYLKNPMVIKATNPELAAYYDQLIKQRRLQPTSTPTGQVLVGQ